MKKHREKVVHSEVRPPIRDFIKEHKGGRFILDGGHLAIIGDGRSSTIIITASGEAICLECGY
jgi:hypothetical protein